MPSKWVTSGLSPGQVRDRSGLVWTLGLAGNVKDAFVDLSPCLKLGRKGRSCASARHLLALLLILNGVSSFSLWERRG